MQQYHSSSVVIVLYPSFIVEILVYDGAKLKITNIEPIWLYNFVCKHFVRTWFELSGVKFWLELSIAKICVFYC